MFRSRAVLFLLRRERAKHMQRVMALRLLSDGLSSQFYGWMAQFITRESLTQNNGRLTPFNAIWEVTAWQRMI